MQLWIVFATAATATGSSIIIIDIFWLFSPFIFLPQAVQQFFSGLYLCFSSHHPRPFLWVFQVTRVQPSNGAFPAIVTLVAVALPTSLKHYYCYFFGTFLSLAVSRAVLLFGVFLFSRHCCSSLHRPPRSHNFCCLLLLFSPVASVQFAQL